MDRFSNDKKIENDSSIEKVTENVITNDHNFEGRDRYEMDIDRMVNEGLGGGYVSDQNGYIGDTSVDEM